MTDPTLAAMPDTFRYSEARKKFNERQFRNLLAQGRITAIARGLYRKSDWHGEEDLIEISAKAPRATICLRSALARHDLIDDIPATIDIALPRNSWRPTTDLPVSWHSFDIQTFDIGRDELTLTEHATIGLYSAERSIIDAFRLRHLEGHELANEALKSWLRAGGQASQLLLLARSFPRAATPLRQTLEILL